MLLLLTFLETNFAFDVLEIEETPELLPKRSTLWFAPIGSSLIAIRVGDNVVVDSFIVVPVTGTEFKVD
jgi:hypothetical protein